MAEHNDARQEEYKKEGKEDDLAPAQVFSYPVQDEGEIRDLEAHVQGRDPVAEDKAEEAQKDNKED